MESRRPPWPHFLLRNQKLNGSPLKELAASPPARGTHCVLPGANGDNPIISSLYILLRNVHVPKIYVIHFHCNWQICCSLTVLFLCLSSFSEHCVARITLQIMYTWSRHKVEHKQASYGRAAAQKESKRHRLKRKLESSTADTGLPTSQENGETTITASERRLTRAQVQVQEELATRAATTPPSKSERLLRGRRLLMCTDCRSRRQFAFQGQGFFFCHPCELWNIRLPDCSIKGSRVSTRFACIAKHECFLHHPTTFCTTHCIVAPFLWSITWPSSILTLGYAHQKEGFGDYFFRVT